MYGTQALVCWIEEQDYKFKISMFDTYNEETYPDVGQWDQKPECSRCGKYLPISAQEDICEACYLDMCKSGTL